MIKVTRVLLTLPIIIGMVGCSQDEAKPTEEKNVVEANVEPKGAEGDAILNHLEGTWVNEDSMLTISADSSTIKFVYEYYDESQELDLEIKKLEDKEINAVLTSVNGESDDTGEEYTLTLNDSNHLMVTMKANQDTMDFPMYTKLTTDESKVNELTSDVVGNWANEEAYVRLSKRNNNLIMGLKDENENKEWENVVEIQGIADNFIYGTIVDSGGDASDLGQNLIFALKDSDELVIKVGFETINLKKTEMEREAWKAEREVWLEEYDVFVDIVNDFIDYDEVWNASTGEEEVSFYAYFEGEEFVVGSSELGMTENDSEDLAIIVETYSERNLEGVIWKAPESKEQWIGKNITIEKTEQKTIVITIDGEEIILLQQ